MRRGGHGKTTLCRAVLESLDRQTFAAFVPDPFLSREDLLKTLLVDFGVVSVEEMRSGRLRGASRTDLSYPLYEFLASLQPLKAFAVVMIDEAQNLTAELLEEIRILSDLEHGQKLLEVVLVGQPELQARLATPGMRQLSQRVSIRCELSPLVRGDIARYVSHRLTVAGNDGSVQFTDAAIEFVWAASHGTPRVINLVCDRALLCAARSRTMRVEAQHVVWAVDDLRLPVPATFDQARALESFAQELPSPDADAPAESAESEEQPEPPPIEAFVPGVEDEPGDPFKSFLRESRQAVAERKDQPEPPQPPPSPHVLGADFSRTGGASRVDDARESIFPSAGARTLAFNADLAAARQRRQRSLTLAGISLALTAALLGGYWYSTQPVSPRPSDGLTQSARTREAVNLSPTTAGKPDTSAASGRPSADAVTPARAGVRASSPPCLGKPLPGSRFRWRRFRAPHAPRRRFKSSATPATTPTALNDRYATGRLPTPCFSGPTRSAPQPKAIVSARVRFPATAPVSSCRSAPYLLRKFSKPVDGRASGIPRTKVRGPRFNQSLGSELVVLDFEVGTFEHFLQVDREPRQQRCRQRIAGLCAQLRGFHEGAIRSAEYFDCIEPGIDDPVFAHAEPVVERSLQRFINAARTQRDDLNDEVRRAAHVALGQDVLALVRNIQEVGRDDVEVREEDVEMRKED